MSPDYGCSVDLVLHWGFMGSVRGHCYEGSTDWRCLVWGMIWDSELDVRLAGR
jgi:hypothetical protein